MYHFIINPVSRTGKGKALWAVLKSELEARKVEYETHYIEYAGHASELARELSSAEGEKKIIIVGGDGTVNSVINGLVLSDDLYVGYIPTGSGNDFGRGLGLPDDYLDALRLILKSTETKKIDIGEITYFNGDAPKRFAVSAGIGYDADVCYYADTSTLKSVLNFFGIGKLVYFIFGMILLFKNKPAAASITIDGKTTVVKNLKFLANMNLPYEGGGLPMGPGADPTDGTLTSCMVHNISKLSHLLAMPTIFKGTHINRKGIDLVSGHSIEIQTDRPLILHTDGEYAGQHDHVIFSFADDKLNLMC